MTNKTINRRSFLKGATASMLMYQLPVIGATHTNKKVIWVLLRGALDGLHTVVPVNDEQYQQLRPKLAKSFKQPLLPLTTQFGLHPSLKFIHQLYQHKQALPIVAVGSGYKARSHFSGQDFLECGQSIIDHDNGWLNRMLSVKQNEGVAIARSVPLSFRGNKNVSTWYPSALKQANQSLMDSLDTLYANDDTLSASLSEGLSYRNLATTKSKNARKQGQFSALASQCAKIMTSDRQTNVAMLEMGGWDTHSRQSIRLEKQFTELDKGIEALRKGLADDWKNTLVVVATEFGRTAAENGTGGTDHGAASAMFLLGGAVKGGNVVGQWPGLAEADLHKNRDLQPTSSTFDWIASATSQHFDMSVEQMNYVFPLCEHYKRALINS